MSASSSSGNNKDKAKKYLCTFASLCLLPEFKVFKKVPDKPGQAECSICDQGKAKKAIVTVSFKGKSAFTDHLNTEKHKIAIETLNKNSSLEKFWVFQPEDQKVIAAEATLAYHNAVHKSPFRAVDCTHKLLPKLFPDSKIATKISCGRTKTEAILKGVLSEYSLELHTKQLENVYFLSVGTDGSNHGSLKMFPVIVRYFDMKKGILHFLIEFKALPNEKAKTIADYVQDATKSRSIEKQVIAFSADNTNTNFGGMKRNEGDNIFSKLKGKLVVRFT